MFSRIQKMARVRVTAVVEAPVQEAPSADQATNVFFALKPDPHDAQRISDLGGRLLADGAVWGWRTPPACLHLTLIGVGKARGRIPAGAAKALCEAVADVRFPSFDVVLDRVVKFRSAAAQAPVVAAGSDGCVETSALRLAIRDALRVKGLRWPVPASFTPHVTLFRGGSAAPEIAIEPLQWTATRFVLAESWIGRTKHVELGAWPLRAARD